MRRNLLIWSAAGLVLVAALVGGFFAGQSTRASDTEVRATIASEVREAVDRTMREQILLRRKVIREVRADQKKKDRALMRQMRGKLQKAAEERAAASYASGQSTGYSAGSADGYDEGSVDGAIEASDDLDCSDDPDVGWLPYCE